MRAVQVSNGLLLELDLGMDLLQSLTAGYNQITGFDD
jgi:hypothetical protein